MRWEHGPVIPQEVRANMTEQEAQYFANYNKILANYMGSLGENNGLDLTQDLHPPKTVMVEVKERRKKKENNKINFTLHNFDVLCMVEFLINRFV